MVVGDPPLMYRKNIALSIALVLGCSSPTFAAKFNPAPQANNDTASVVVGGNANVSGNVITNDLYGNLVTINGSSAGQYGVLGLNASGNYTYQLYSNEVTANIRSGETVFDYFSYSYSNNTGQSDGATLTIEIKGNTEIPIAVDDAAVIVIGENLSVSGNLSDNDRNGRIVTMDGSALGGYGYLELIGSSGAYSYTLYKNSDSLPAGSQVTDSFAYTYSNDLGQSATATLVVEISANTSSPVAVNDTASVVVNVNPTASGNVTDNDLRGQTVTSNGSTSGQYGFLTLSSSGAYKYTLYDNSNNLTLANGATVTDTFSYKYSNNLGQSSTASLVVNIKGNPETPIANDDVVTVVINRDNSLVSGNVNTNDSKGKTVQLTSSPSSEYGFLVLNADGSFIYTAHKNAPAVIALEAGQVVTDIFDYTYIDGAGRSAKAQLSVQVIGNPIDGNGNTIFKQPEGDPFDNVDIEFNDRSAKAVPLNSGKNIKGHLYGSGDKDWFILKKARNESIVLEVCPQGTSCFGKKSWVLYIFKRDLLTVAMEEKSVVFDRWVDETGSINDLLGNGIISGVSSAAASNHMYLAYRSGIFDSALIGIVDPCFGSLNAVELGVEDIDEDYFIAISSPLKGDSGDAGSCGVGSVILQRPGVSVLGKDAKGEAKSYTTTEEYISVFPNSDDQYVINVTRTGRNPLLSAQAKSRAATYDSSTGDLIIPRVRVSEEIVQATLSLARQARSSESAMKFILSEIDTLSIDEVVDVYRATYNPENQQVIIPRVAVVDTGKAYSVIMQYYPVVDGKAAWFEVVNIEEIR